MIDIFVRKLAGVTSRWLGKVWAMLPTKPGDGGMVDTCDGGDLMGRMTSIEEVDDVGLFGSGEGLHGQL